MGTRFSIAWYVGIVNDFVKTRIVYLNIVLRLIFRRNILVHTLPNNQGALQLCFYNCLMTAVHAVCQNLNGQVCHLCFWQRNSGQHRDSVLRFYNIVTGNDRRVIVPIFALCQIFQHADCQNIVGAVKCTGWCFLLRKICHSLIAIFLIGRDIINIINIRCNAVVHQSLLISNVPGLW